MATRFQVVIDCADPGSLADFWAAALGYIEQPPPEGYPDWPTFLRELGWSDDQMNDASAIVDPDGIGSRVYFQRVPEPKVVKNRVHLDINASGRAHLTQDERQRRVDDEVERLVGLGATKQQEMTQHGEYWVVMQDPEGNEFCVQ